MHDNLKRWWREFAAESEGILGIQQIEVKKRVRAMAFIPSVLLYCEFDTLIAVIVRE
jgi:hypothetical protein